jgi:hypothetical protein
VSFNEFCYDALEKRNLALIQKRFAIKLKQDAIVLRDKLNTILFGDAANYGIVSVIQQYYKLLQIGNGLNTNTPSFDSLQTAKNQFINEFALSVAVPGDGEGGIYPPDPQIPSMGMEKPNPDSVWFTNFSLQTSASSTGVIQRINELLILIDTATSQNINENDGSGSSDGFPSKIHFMNGLDNLTNILNDWKNQTETIIETLNGANGEIITEYKIDLPIEDLENLSTSLTQANVFLHTIQEYAAYFNNFLGTGTAAQTQLREKLNNLRNYIGVIRDNINTRCNAIPLLMGDASNGLKKHLIFWIKDVTKKPDGPYALLSTADDMITNSVDKIKNEDDRLSFFEQDKDRWILTPNLTLIYDDPILELDKTVKERRITLVWEPIASANKYRILIKPFNEIRNNLTNDFWDDAETYWITEKNSKTGLLQNTLTIPAPGVPISIRMAAYDSNEGDSGYFDRMDIFDSCSIQTNIVSEELPFIQLDPVGSATVLSINESENLREQHNIWINHSVLAAVFSISEDMIQLDKDYGEIESVQKLFGFYTPLGYSGPDED